ncbi:hypothetical protein FALBO_11041 [Fusarium albosuccineum]|uniref:Uncharacterized protein n=1 Tax=Fusarium albosuccineum TaxID=1237068 RepID=A0A8H4L2Z7_9HYPO|nr:hypothetical protein FALBO_11041 [Fusarium albosuccineum]
MRLVAWGLWLASVHIAQAAVSGRHGQRAARKRQAAGEVGALKFEGLRLSYITETTTEKVTEVQTVMQTIQNEATAAAETVTVTINAPAVTVTEVAQAPPPITVTETVTEAAVQPVTVVEVSPITIVEVSPITVAGEAPPPVTIIQTVNAPAGVVDTPQEEPVNGGGVGVSTVPIAESALPTTTFSQDPLPQSLVKESTAEESSAPGETIAPGETSAPGENTAAVPAVPATDVVSSAPQDTTQAISTTDNASSQPTSAAEDSSTTDNASSQPTDTTENVSATNAVSSTAQDAAQDTSTTEAASDTTAPGTTAQTEETSAAASTQPTMDSNLTLKPSVNEPAEPTDLSNSVDLGGLGPDASADLESAVLDGPAPTAAPDAEESSRSRAPINISSLTLSRSLNLGNLAGAGGAGLLRARATGTP